MSSHAWESVAMYVVLAAVTIAGTVGCRQKDEPPAGPLTPLSAKSSDATTTTAAAPDRHTEPQVPAPPPTSEPRQIQSVPRPVKPNKPFASARVVSLDGGRAILVGAGDIVAGACRLFDDQRRTDQTLSAEQARAIEVASAYLSAQSLLPPKWRLCATNGDAGRWQITVFALPPYVNSPVTVVIEHGKVVGRYFSDGNDPRETLESNVPNILEIYRLRGD